MVVTQEEEPYNALPLTPRQAIDPKNSQSYQVPPLPFSQQENPLTTASIWSILTTRWVHPLIALGAKQILQKQDIWPVCSQDSSDALETRFFQAYDSTMCKTPFGITRVAFAFLKTFRRELTIVFANYFIYIFAMALQAYIAQAVLDFLSYRKNAFHIDNGYILVAMLSVVSLTAIMTLNFGFFYASRVGANIRSLIMTLVYQKSLRLSSMARQGYTTGEITTLMSVDAERIFNAMIQGPWLICAPLGFLITILLITLLFDFIAALCAAVVLVGVLFISAHQAKQISSSQQDLLGVVDERVKVTAEALHGIRVLKLYAWEDAIARRVQMIREKEIRLFRKFQFHQITNAVLLFLTPMFMSGVALSCYVLVHGTISVTDAFTLIAVVNICRTAVNLFPLAIAALSQSKIAFSRIDKFLSSEELQSNILFSHNSGGMSMKGSVVVTDARFEWITSASKSLPDITMEILSTPEPQTGGFEARHGFALDGINITIDAGSLVMIVGAVGAGKSSLINGLLGEMKLTTGICSVNGEVSYVSQEAWIQNASVKDNIIFASPFDPERFDKVMEATQLAMDLEMLPNGDQTEIGERGINLSGGQKARVAIGRAIYRPNYDILILDDPLSAVDPHVAHAIFHQCIMGLAKDKTRILVLNSHYDLLSYADKILVVQDGQIAGDGIYEAIMAQFPHLCVQTKALAEMENELVDEYQYPEETKEGIGSTGAVKTVAKNQKSGSNENERLIQAEDRVEGKVTSQTYMTYFNETGFHAITVLLVLFVAYSGTQGLRTIVDWWQGHWASNMNHKSIHPTYSATWFGMWYLAFIVLSTIAAFGRGLLVMESCIRSSARLHNELFCRILRAPLNRYFDVTPVGRILNRFSNDLDQMDAFLPQQYQLLFQNMTTTLGSLIVAAMASFWIGISYVPMVVLFVMTGQYFKKSSREIKRLEGITRTPVFSVFNETLTGLSTIRAFRMQETFKNRNKQTVDENTTLYLTYWAAGRWLAVRLDSLSVMIIFIVSLYLVATKGKISVIVSGISLTYSLMLTSTMQSTVRSVDRTDNAMTSVERLLHFREIPVEHDNANATPISNGVWPLHGAVRFDNLHLKYRPDLPLVLRGVNMEIAAGEKVGICGRTGAGKSSLMIALFRICEFERGTIFIDGVDIMSIKLQDLRQSLAIIPQDPVLFSGSLRENIDPFGEHTDDRIWSVLKQVHLFDTVVNWGSGLDFVISERGDNLSVGQRQLLCISRALLKDSKIVVLDEATANVDNVTDSLIQSTIQTSFVDKTVLTIAHRINTIMHCDKIAVMDAGQVVQFGTPSVLLSQPQSIFAALANKAMQNEATR